MSRFLLLLCAASLIAACEQPGSPKTTTAPASTSAVSSEANSDHDLCYQRKDRVRQQTMEACQRLIATGEYQGYTLAVFHNNVGVDLRHLHKYTESIEAYDKALVAKPDYDTAWQNKSYSLAYLDRYEEALEAAQKAVEFGPDDAGNVGQLGYVLRNLGRYKEAREALELSLALDPTKSWTISELGWLLHAESKLEEALRQFKKARKAAPEYSWAHYAIGFTLIDLDRPEEAIAPLNRAIQLDPTESSFHNLRGYIDLLEDKPFFDAARAAQRLERATRLNPTDHYAMHHLAIAYAYQGRGSDALEQLRKGIRIKPLKNKVRRVIRILWDKQLTEDAKAVSELLKQSAT